MFNSESTNGGGSASSSPYDNMKNKNSVSNHYKNDNGILIINNITMPINVLVMLPYKESAYDTFGLVMSAARPAIDKGIERAVNHSLIRKDQLNFTYIDSRLWEDQVLTERHTAVAMIEAYRRNELDLMLGLADSYSIATLSKIGAGLGKGVPLITTAGFPAALSSRKSFTYLTRMRGSYDLMAESVYCFLGYDDQVTKNESKRQLNTCGNDVTGKSGRNGPLSSTSNNKNTGENNWNRSNTVNNGANVKSNSKDCFGGQEIKRISHIMEYKNMTFVYHDKKRAMGGKQYTNMEGLSSHCYFSVYAIKHYFTMNSNFYREVWRGVTPSVAFDEDQDNTTQKLVEVLKRASYTSNVFILCASPDTVRRMMLAASELNMINSGTYVFINIDISTGSLTKTPWIRGDKDDDAARLAFRALKTISLRRDKLDEYKQFEKDVAVLAENKYEYSKHAKKNYSMNNFISAFYEAVYLYALALNETLEAHLDPRCGEDITSKMWNRSFAGITGNVSIDSNGDRLSDYSLLDYDPDKDEFVEVAYYSGHEKKLTKAANLHWVNGHAPKDWPVCGWDGTLCPKPNYLVIIIGTVIGFVFLAVGTTAVYFQRRYVLEKELAAMSWKIRWEDLNGDESKKEKKKKRSRRIAGFWYETEALLKSNSRTSSVSEKKSVSSGATRKISALIDKKLGQIWRKKSPQDEEMGNHKENMEIDVSILITLTKFKLILHRLSIQRYPSSEGGGCAEDHSECKKPSTSVSSAPADGSKKKVSTTDEEVAQKKSFSLYNRKHSYGEETLKSGGSIETIQQQNTQVFIATAVYKGSIVALKKLKIDPKKYPKLELSRDQLLEFKKMKDLQCDHITRFTGACVECPYYYLVQEYCPRGSLEDILESEKIDLDRMMKLSLLHDLVKGMHFLHNSFVGSHGRLKPSNCVIDSHLVLKITDFGFVKLRELEDENLEELGEHAAYQRKFWTAPEILREPEKYKLCGTKAGDVYSFAIILHEMVFTKGHFYLNEEPKPTPKAVPEIIERVKRIPPKGGPFVRPEVQELVDSSDVDKALITFMEDCWHEDPTHRPDFSIIRKYVRSLNKENETSNLVDNLVMRMEQYANNLEGLVEERTQDYLNEKQKVENLLHQLLPPSVADQLISGHPVEAEMFDSVTIYFSDIVGFTALSSVSTPMQVVTFLNDLYSLFDKVVDSYNVYKVETIGDAYMVVSGLPERCEDHASQIAQMSLAVLHHIKTFVIRHRADTQLKLRIGIHSGSVVAGVVGSKMPRYCLFGDTVNTSSRMESTGLPLKIHVSSETKAMLDSYPGFRLEYRGEVEMKGKGILKTYWLTGYQDIDIPDFSRST
uniref:Guanylate cyclase n=1 Tax=Syphacia muris TaxID=451379 RepID=A0A0N5ATB9_9BILA